jgi:hypothetical protein
VLARPPELAKLGQRPANWIAGVRVGRRIEQISESLQGEFVGGGQALRNLYRRPVLSSISRWHRCSLPFCLVADGQLVGQIVAAAVTFIWTGGAAFLGARVANRSTKVVDERAKKTAEWERIDRLAAMACSKNDTETYVVCITFNSRSRLEERS